MVRMRTIKQTLKYFKDKDPDSAITEWWLRNLIKNGILKHHKSGNKYLINLDYLELFLTETHN